MKDDLIALAGDLVFERKSLSERVRRIEALLLHDPLAKDFLQKIGIDRAEEVHGDIDQIISGLDRIGAITKTLVQKINRERLVDCSPFIQSIEDKISETALECKRDIDCHTVRGPVMADRYLIEDFKQAFFQVLPSIIGFGFESARERAARKKSEKTFLSIEMLPSEDGHCISLEWDGNGVNPPIEGEFGVLFARLGVRVEFSGVVARQSQLRFLLPSNVGALRCHAMRVGNRTICVPSWSVLTKESQLGEPTLQTYALGESLGRFEIDPEYPGNYGSTRICIAAGTNSATYVVNGVSPPEEMFLKPLAGDFNGNGRFLGVVANESTSELWLVLNPAYLVYGFEDKPTEKKEKVVLLKEVTGGR